MSLLPRLWEAARHIQTRSPLRPTVGVILGSGLGSFAGSLQDATNIPFRQIPHFPAATAVGHHGELVLGRSGGVPVAVMAGRVHYYEGYSLEQVVFPVRVLGRLGVNVLIVTNAAGSVNAAFKPGDIMVIEDHINFMGGNPLVGPNEDELGERFFDMTEPYDPALRKIAEKAFRKAHMVLRRGVYIAVPGPSYETPAEIRMARKLGADAIGMSTVPEVIAARHMGVRVLGISCLTNMGAGILKKTLDHREVLAVGERVKAGLLAALERIIQEAAKG